MLYFDKTMDEVSLEFHCNNKKNIIIITIIIPFATLIKKFYIHTEDLYTLIFSMDRQTNCMNPVLTLTPPSHLSLKHNYK